MLSDWYFCTSLGYSSKRITKMLTFMDLIRYSDDPKLLSITFNELRKSDERMQIYALPQILLRLLQTTNRNILVILQDFVTNLFDELEDTQSHCLKKLYLDVESNERKLVAKIEDCSKILVETAFLRVQTPNAYGNTASFQPEVALFSFVFGMSYSNTRFRNAVSSALAANNMMNFQQLLNLSTKHQYGRLPFRLGLRIQSLIDRGDSIPTVYEALAENDNMVAELEPDILQTLINIIFIDSTENDLNPELSAERMLLESRNLVHFRKFVRNLFRIRGRKRVDVTSIMQSLGMRNYTEADRKTVPIVLWQCLLWQTAADVAPHKTAEELSAIWEPQRNQVGLASLYLDTNQPAFKKEFHDLKDTLIRLSDIHGIRVKFRWKDRKGILDVEETSRSIFLSPWIPFDRNSIRSNTDRYPQSNNRLSVIRLLSASYSASKLLSKTDNAGARSSFAMLIMHCKSVLDNNHELQKYSSDDFSIFEINGLAVFCDITFKRLTYDLKIDPKWFVNLRHLLDDPDAGLGSDEKFFLSVAMPEVAMSWIQDIYNSIATNKSAGRWLRHIPELYDHMTSASRGVSSYYKNLARQIFRFLVPNYADLGLDLSRFNWQEYIRQHPEGNLKSNRLLISPKLPATEWKDFEDKLSYNEENTEKDFHVRQLRLVRSIEQIDSLSHPLVSESEYNQLSSDWLHDWRTTLEDTHEKNDISRFARLRLIELIDSPTIADSFEDQLLIAYLILEFGSEFDLNQLFERLFWDDWNLDDLSDKLLLKPANDARQQVRLAVVEYVAKEMTLERKETDEHAESRTPYDIQGERNHINLLRNFIRKLLLESLLLPANFDLSELEDAIKSVRRKTIISLPNLNIRRLKADLNTINTYKKLSDTKDQEFADWQVLRAHIDVNHNQANLVYQLIRYSNSHNLFSYDRETLLNIIYNDDEGYINICAKLLHHSYDINKQTHIYIFAAGLPWPVEISLSQEIYSNPTGWFNLQVRRNPHAHSIDNKWIGNASSLQPLFFQEVLQDYVAGPVIREAFDKATETRRLQFKHPYKKENNYSRRYWDVDISRKFAPYFKKNTSIRELETDVAQIVGYRKEHPYTYQFDDLISYGKSYGSGDELIYVLVLVEPPSVNSIDGTSSWLFATQPGENYLIHEHELNNKLVEQLESILDELSVPSGLILTAKPGMDEFGIVQLQAPNKLPEVSDLFDFFPELEYPIDLRNVHWRFIFDYAEEPYYANKDENGRWFYDLVGKLELPSNFPTKLYVKFKNRSPNNNVSVAEIVSPIWRDWYREDGRYWVEAYTPEQYEINPINTDDEFMTQWKKPVVNEQVNLIKVIGSLRPRSEGLVVCLTEEGIAVNVPIESLSQKWLQLNERIEITVDYPRAARIVYGGGWRKRNSVVLNIQQSDLASNNGKYFGIVLSTPKDYTQSQVCEVLWDCGTYTTRTKIVITNISDLAKMRPGDAIKGSEQELALYTRFISAEAVWELSDFGIDNTPHELTFLGFINRSGQKKPVAEGFPGQLVLLPLHFPQVSHLAQIRINGEEIEIDEGIGRNDTITHQAPERSRLYRRDMFRCLAQHELGVIVGYSTQLLTGRLRWLNAVYSIDEVSDKQVFLYREIEVRQQVVEKASRPKPQQSNDRLIRYERELREYLAKEGDFNLAATIKGSTAILKNLFVPANTQRTLWGNEVPLIDTDTHILLRTDYSQEALVRVLEQIDGRIVASTRQTESVTLQLYFDSLGAQLNRTINLDEYLYYIGDQTHTSPDGVDERYRLFEWGYGKVLIVNETQLRFNGQPFATSSALLLHGDYITSIEFVEQHPDEETVDDDLLINIENYSLEFSEGRRLYSQRHYYKVIHRIHLLILDNELVVKYVEAFNEDSIQQSSTPFRKISNITKLTENSYAYLSQLISKYNEGDTLIINGRLDEEEYLETSGRHILFEYVYLGFEKIEGVSSLRNNELVFLKEDNVELWSGGNDYAVIVKKPNDVNQEFVSKEIDGIPILRRKFSVREDLLRRVYNQNPNYFTRLVLVRLSKSEKESDSRIFASMMNVPPRNARAIARANTAIEWATWLKQRNANDPKKMTIDLEIRPGVIVQLANSSEMDIETYPSDISKGALVRLSIRSETNSKVKISIIRGSYSDTRYVPQPGRNVVVFPKNNILKARDKARGVEINEDSYWNTIKGFTIGGLPNIVATPSFYHHKRKKWFSAHWQDVYALMQTPHPKIAYLGRDDGKFKISTSYNIRTVGRLQFTKNDNGICFIPITEKGTEKKLYWRYQTFQNTSISNLVERLEREVWHYHDETTGHWEDNEDINYPTGDHSVIRGPVFFQNDSELRLRYTLNRFLEFGYPVNEFLNRIRNSGSSIMSCVVAGSTQQGDIWIELALGRIVEIPKEIVTIEHNGKDIPLDYFAWQLLTAGDRLDVGVRIGDPVAIDSVCFFDWLPSTRAAFGNRTAILPVSSFDIEMGALTVGSGLYTVVVPVANLEFEENIILTPQNDLNPLNRLPTHGEVVLLGMDETEQIIIHGVSGFSPVPSNKVHWTQDTLNITLRNGKRVSLDNRRLKEILKITGTLPVTVDFALAKNNIVFFSLIEQQKASKLASGQVCVGRILGTIENGREFLIQLGGGLICLPFDQVIGGIDDGNKHAVAEFLANNEPRLWLRMSPSDILEIGFLPEERSSELTVTGLHFVYDEDNQRGGLLCQSIYSLRYYWLPTTWLALTNLGKDQIISLFIGKTFSVTRQQDLISIRHLKYVRNLLTRLRISDELSVRVVEFDGINSDGIKQYIVQYGLSQLMLKCISYEVDRIEIGSDLTVQVIQVNASTGRADVLVVPTNERRYKLDLPQWLVHKDIHRMTSVVSEYNHWRENLPELDDYIPDDIILGKYDDILPELVCYAYGDLTFNNANVEFQIQVANRWLKQYLLANEIDVALSIMVLAILFWNGLKSEDNLIMHFRHLSDERELTHMRRKWLDKASNLLVNLGRRAMRSIHVELYANHLEEIDRREEDYNTDKVWSRLLHIYQLIDEYITKDELNTIKQFYRVSYLRTTGMAIFAKSLAIAAGVDIDFTDDEIEKAQVVNEILSIYNSIHMNAQDQIRLHKKHHVKRLEDLLSRILKNWPSNVILLSAFPYHSKDD